MKRKDFGLRAYLILATAGSLRDGARGEERGESRDNMARVRRQKIRMLPHPTLSRWEKEKYERERHWILD